MRTCVLVDTSVWIEHFRRRSDLLSRLLDAEAALTHPMVLGEVACGTPPKRWRTLADLKTLRQPSLATLQEVMAFMEGERIHGLGCGFVDMSLLTSTLLTPEARLWTLDKRLAGLAARFNVAYQPSLH